MEITKTPLYLASMQCFHIDQATERCKHLLPERDFNATDTMVGTLSQIFCCIAEDLCISVHDQMSALDKGLQVAIEHWLMQHGIMKKEYLW